MEGLIEVELEQLEIAVAKPTHLPVAGPKARLEVAAGPDPFVAPTLRLEGGASPEFAAEVVFVRAPAAVGKSIVAKHLSSRKQLPLLDLAVVRVSTHSLLGILQGEFPAAAESIQAFHAGTLPLVVDALDEGRLHSTEAGFEAFFETAGELLHSDRTATSHPKLILFGRPESIDLAKTAICIGGPHTTTCTAEIGFFHEVAAWKLIGAYARSSAKPGAAYFQHPEPVKQLISAYFKAIESALALQEGTLWSEDRGRAFAGYAPVLEAIGYLLGRSETEEEDEEAQNFIDIMNRLQRTGQNEAWDVIETVLRAILKREQYKLCRQLTKHMATSVPSEAYDAEEQLTLLVRHIYDHPLWTSSRAYLHGHAQITYRKMVEQQLPEHPFLRQRDFANEVLGSLVLAHAVDDDLLQGMDLDRLESSSRQPFLWRSLRHHLAAKDSLIDGRYLGCALLSFWNDPSTRTSSVAIRTINGDGSAVVSVGAGSEGQLDFHVTLPLTLYGQARDCDMDVSGTVILKGQVPRKGSVTAFHVSGKTTIICDELEIRAQSVTLDGKIWLETSGITQDSPLEVEVKKDPMAAVDSTPYTQVGMAGVIAGRYPWNRIPSTLPPPYMVRGDDVLTIIVEECCKRIGSTVLTLNEDFSVPVDDLRVRWLARQFADEFPRLVKLMIDRGFASADPMPARGHDTKQRVRFDVKWTDIRDALRRPQVAASSFQDFLEAARNVLSRSH